MLNALVSVKVPWKYCTFFGIDCSRKYLPAWSVGVEGISRSPGGPKIAVKVPAFPGAGKQHVTGCLAFLSQQF
jgi:hypothetical protein